MKTLLITFLLSLVIFVGFAKSQSCVQYISSNQYYDFSPLGNETLSYIAADGNTYFFSICNVSQYCTNSFGNSAACQYYTQKKFMVDIGGLKNFKLTTNNTGGQLVYTGSNKDCPTRENRITIINLICDRYSQTKVEYIVEDPICTYTINVRSSLACPYTTKPRPTPTVTTTPYPNNSGSVTTSTTTTSPDDDTTITQTITQRYNSYSNLVSSTNTTTITNTAGTNTQTTTSVYKNGEVKVTTTSTYLQGSTVTTNTLN